MKPGSELRVDVYNTIPFETLTVDLSSFTAVLRPDTFQTIFNSLTPNASKATGVEQILKNGAAVPFPKVDLATLETSAETAIYGQNRVIDETDASLVLQQIAVASQGIPRQGCFISVANTTDEFPNPWFETDRWKRKVVDRLAIAHDGTAKKADDLTNEAKPIHDQITTLQQNAKEWNVYVASPAGKKQKLSEDDQRKLNHINQLVEALQVQDQALNYKITIRGDVGNGNKEPDRLDALSKAVNPIVGNPVTTDAHTKNPVTEFVIDVPKSGRAFNVSGVWALNYTNFLTNAVSPMSQSSYAPGPQLSSSYAQLSASAKTQAMSITVQSTNKEWVEASAGFLVPVRAYHSYSAAAQASGGTVVNNVVQETLTHTVVPAAFVNMNLLEIPNRHGSWAFFVSPFVGYNASTSAVETGIGPSMSWRSIQLDLMADYASDTYLKGGFTVGQSLGASNPASPLTKNAYSWRFAPGISIRIPLGGSSGSSGTSGATASSGSTSASGAATSGGKHSH
jgi:hypothetical protein